MTQPIGQNASYPPVAYPIAARELKTASIFTRMIHSTLFWGLALPVVMGLITPVFLAVSALALFIFARFKQVIYETTLCYGYITNKFYPQHYPIYSKITDSIFLGRLPLKNTGDQIAIQKEGITAVLTMTEKFENHSLGLLSDPVTPEEWHSLGIKQHQIETPDFHEPSSETLDRAVTVLDGWLKSGEKVLVHCKAGRGRSAEVVIAYLFQKQPDQYPTFESARLYVKARRPHITVRAR